MELDVLDSLQLLQITEGAHHTRMASYVQNRELRVVSHGQVGGDPTCVVGMIRSVDRYQ